MRPDTSTGTRRHWRVLGATLIVVSALCVTACTPEATRPSASPAAPATEAPLFASDEEALNAARATYEGFLAASGAILEENGAYPERIDEYAIADVADDEKKGFATLAATGSRVIGRTVLDIAVLQSYRPMDSDGQDVVSIYACVNVSGVSVFDSGGQSIVAPDRPDKTAFEVSFDRSDAHPTKLRISSNVIWPGVGVC
jgi:hypothetical protein